MTTRRPAHPLDVWRCSLDGWAATCSERGAWALLDDAERARAERFRTAADRRRYTAARAALRQILAGYLGVPAERVAVRVAPLGRPELDPAKHPVPLRFSLSHAGDLAVVVVTSARSVGVDVEYVDPTFPCELVAPECLGPDELAEWSALDPTRRSRAFFRRWTAKEAVVKATGEGAARSLCSVRICGPISTISGPDAPVGRWSLRTFAPIPGYLATVAIGMEADMAASADDGSTGSKVPRAIGGWRALARVPGQCPTALRSYSFDGNGTGVRLSDEATERGSRWPSSF